MKHFLFFLLFFSGVIFILTELLLSPNEQQNIYPSYIFNGIKKESYFSKYTCQTINVPQYKRTISPENKNEVYFKNNFKNSTYVVDQKYNDDYKNENANNQIFDDTDINYSNDRKSNNVEITSFNLQSINSNNQLKQVSLLKRKVGLQQLRSNVSINMTNGEITSDLIGHTVENNQNSIQKIGIISPGDESDLDPTPIPVEESYALYLYIFIFFALRKYANGRHIRLYWKTMKS